MQRKHLICFVFLAILCIAPILALWHPWRISFSGIVDYSESQEIRLLLPDGRQVNTWTVKVLGANGIAIQDFLLQSTYYEDTQVTWSFTANASVEAFFKFWNESVTPNGGWDWWAPNTPLQIKAKETRQMQLLILTGETSHGIFVMQIELVYPLHQ